ncbi:hypothetical protein ABEY41_24680 [Peribacillus butanolivorans]|uniref:hypothetical protein n=1 Tax=Peribacillus butanolivorans TaxID=421767 RepID=UPI003D2D0A12
MRKTIGIKENNAKISVIWVISILFIAANLRAPITSIGPLISLIRDDTGINNAVAGMVTTTFCGRFFYAKESFGTV